ncbi:MAG: Crp/Fnr family transcriptional regulator, partial [Actinomycetota bacterium]
IVTFFYRLLPAELQELERYGTRQTYNRGECIFHEGDPPERVFLILSGRVKVAWNTEDGREVILAVREAGDLLGELSAIDGDTRSATASVLEAVEVIAVQADAFKKFLEDHPRVSRLMIEMLSRRLRDADLKRIELSGMPAVRRVARRLLEMVERFGKSGEAGHRITLPLSQSELAAWTGVSREAVSKALQNLKARGIVETHRRGITVLALDELRTLAN